MSTPPHRPNVGTPLAPDVLLGISLSRIVVENNTVAARGWLEDGQLNAERQDGGRLKESDLLNAALAGRTASGNSFALRLRDSRVDPEFPDLVLYRVEYFQRSTRLWRSLCPGEDEGADDVLLLAGIWLPNGVHEDSPEMATPACRHSALAKCVRWGYAPWKTIAGRSLAPFHQACTRAIRADYLGDGKSCTKDGTLIALRDDIGVNEGGLPPGMNFEAEWGPLGALRVERPRFPLAQSLGIPAHRSAGERLIQSFSFPQKETLPCR